MKRQLFSGLKLAAVCSICWFSGCSPRSKESVPSGIGFTNVSLLEEYLDWQVAKGTFISTVDRPIGETNIGETNTVYYVWINNDEAEKFKAWRQSKKTK